MPDPAARGRALDPDRFRQVLGQYPTGVCVVTAIGTDDAPVGLAVGSFTSVSLDPPLVAFLPSATSSSWPRIRASGRFCVNVLAADQEHLCRVFASKAPDKFVDLGWRPAGSGSPILDDAVAWVDCDLEAVHEAGDHEIVVGRVRDLDLERPTLPLLFFQGGYGTFSPHSLAVRDTRFGRQLQLIDRARPLMEALATRTGGQIVTAYCDGSTHTLLASAGTPTDPGVSPAAIGQHLPVAAPMGIWWIAFVEPERIERWLSDIEAPDLRERYRRALGQIRHSGYCLGLAAVRNAVETRLHHAGPGSELSRQDRDVLTALPIDPFDYVPTRPAATPGDRPRSEVVSLWAPTFTPDGQVALGLMLTGCPRDERPPQAHADDLLHLADRVTALACAPPAAPSRE